MADTIFDAIAALGDRITTEISRSRSETAALFERLQTSVDAIREDLTVIGAAGERIRRHGENTRDEARAIADSLANIERLLLKHGSRLDALERRP